MEGLAIGIGAGLCIGMGSGFAAGTAHGWDSARQQLQKQLAGLLRAGEIQIADKHQAPIDPEKVVEMVLPAKRKR